MMLPRAIYEVMIVYLCPTVFIVSEGFVSQSIYLQARIPFTLASQPNSTRLSNVRLMMIGPLYPCGKPCYTGTDNETVKKLTPFFCLHLSNYDGITASNLESHGNVVFS